MINDIVYYALLPVDTPREEMPFVQTRSKIRELVSENVTPALAEGIVLFSTVRFLDYSEDNFGIRYW